MQRASDRRRFGRQRRRIAGALSPDAGRHDAQKSVGDVARPNTTQAVDTVLLRMVGETQTSPLKIMRDYVGLSFGPGKVSFKDYTQFLNRNGLRNAHIGVLRNLFGKTLSGDNDEIDTTFNQAVAEMQKHGALVTDPVSIGGSEADVTTLTTVNSYWFKPGLNDYFATFGVSAPVHSLADIITASEQPGISDKIRPATLQALIEAQKLGDLTDPAACAQIRSCKQACSG